MRELPKGCARLTRGTIAQDAEIIELDVKCARCGSKVTFRLDAKDPDNCTSDPAEAIYWGSPAQSYYFCCEEHLPTRAERRAAR